MSWITELLQSRRLRPQTTSPKGTVAAIDASVKAWLDAAYGVEEGSERQQSEAVDRLREQGPAAIESVAGEYWSNPHEYALRWAMVRCASEVGGDDAAAFLAEVVAAEVGPETSRDIHHFSSVAEETSQRMQALRGLRAAADSGISGAAESVLEALSHPLTAVRYTAYTQARELSTELLDNVEGARVRLQRSELEFGDIQPSEIAEHSFPKEQLQRQAPLGPPPSGNEIELTRSTRTRAPRVTGQEGNQ